MDKSYLISSKLKHKESPEVISYSRYYYWWKKTNVILKLFHSELQKKKISKVLELGIGEGDDFFRLIDIAKQEHLKINFIGIDKDKNNIDFVNYRQKARREREDVWVILSDINNLPFTKNIFDIIICSEVIEHLSQPSMIIRNMLKLLKNKGLLLISTPNKDNFIEKIFKILNRGKKEQKKINLHPSLKSHKEWIKMFRECGFKIEAVRRGSLIFGGARIDKHPFLFSLLLIIDTILDCLPFIGYLSEQCIYCLRKK
jgi:2-polyprenyl-3-methyl-5-hydroxy-6-metoxy-1,4-benzoquinol methylase